MDKFDFMQSIFRWIHVVAGVLWIGLLYFFNWVNGPFAATLDGETKKKVIPELAPRALFWFRWGAAYTWITGVLLLALVFYHGKAVLEDPSRGFNAMVIIAFLITVFGFVIYDAIMKTLGKTNLKAAVGLCCVILFGVICFYIYGAGFSYRGYIIHVGSLFGTIMAFNVWFRIWPNQQKIITATKNGTAPDPAAVATAGLRSRHNTYLSVPLIWTMINTHTTWASSGWGPIPNWINLVVVIAIAWIGVHHLYKKAAKVKGF